MNWMAQNFTRLPNCVAQLKSGVDVLNPIFTDQKFQELKEKIELLKGAIDKLHDEK